MQLTLEIDEVVCVKETSSGPIIGTSGSDNMVLAGVAVTPTGHATRIRTFDLGSFPKAGTRRRYSKPMFIFTVSPHPDVPQLHQVLFLLAETDGGGTVGTLADQLVRDVNAQSARSDKEDGGIITGIIAKEIAKRVAKALLEAALKRLGENAKDDIFPPQIRQVLLTTPALRFPNGKATTDAEIATFRGHGGEYRVEYRWRVGFGED
jgi:hypothetical protein